MADLKTPILPLGKGDSHAQCQLRLERSRVYFERPALVWLVRAVNVCICISLVYCYFPRLSQPWTPERAPTTISSNVSFAQYDPPLNYTKRELVHFDIEEPAYSPTIPSMSINEYLSACQYSHAWNWTGSIRLVQGDPEQRYNFLVGMDISGSSQMAIDSVAWPINSHEHSLQVRCVELQRANMDLDAAVHVEVTVFVKPHSLQFGSFGINAAYLNIEIAESLAFETYHMDLRTKEGNIRCAETEDFTAHEISIVSTSGSITGNWSLPRQIHLETTGWNVANKAIEIDLVPKMWSFGPSMQGVLSASTAGGDIDIRMPLKDNLSMRNMSIDIHSQRGSISGAFVTGSFTSLKAPSGSIDATLLPYYALPATSTLITQTSAEDTNIRVLSPIIDNYYQINPLKNTKSEHATTGGTLTLQYPKEWMGAALGLSETGRVTVEGDRFSTILQEEHLVVARTADELASRIDFSTTTGVGNLVVD